MKKNLSLILTVAAAIGCSATSASAASYTWDATPGTAGIQDGTGTWNTSLTQWLLDGAGSNVAWPNSTSDTAVFGSSGTIVDAAAGTVTVGTVNVGTIQFGTTVTTGYTLATGGTITLGTGIVNNNGAVSSAVNSIISGSTGLAFSGTGTGIVTLNGANDYTGITALSGGGALALGGSTGFGSTAGATASALGTNYTSVASGSSARVNVSTAEAFIINGTGGGNGAIRIVNSNTTFSSLIQLGSASTIVGTFGTGAVLAGDIALGANNTLTVTNISGTIDGKITGTGTSGVALGSSGTTINVTNTANNYTGPTTFAGTLGLGGNNVLGSGQLTMATGNTIQSTDATARTVSNTLNIGNPIFGATSVNTGALTFTNTGTIGSSGKTFTTNVDTTFTNVLSGGASLTKIGAATLTLGGANTYTGGTIVSAGTLLVNGGVAGTTSGTGTGAVTVSNSNTTLGGTGVIAPTGSNIFTINTGSLINPGVTGAAGNLKINLSSTSGALTLASGSSLTFDIGAGSTGDKLSLLNYASGRLATNGNTINISSLGSPMTGNYTLIDFYSDAAGITSTASGISSGFSLGMIPSGWAASLAYNTNSIDLVVTAVPEPSTWVGASLLTWLAALSQRKRLTRKSLTA